ncbi:MAG: DUF1801 domain-containing protein [Bacteroidota bacterium]
MAKATKLSGPEQVADFMRTVTHPLKTTMEALRETLLSANKGITEHIKWNGPSFCFGGDDRITFNLHRKDYILIVFHCGTKQGKEIKGGEPLFKDATGLLEWLSNQRAIIKFYSLDEVNEKKAKLIKVVKQWIKGTCN